MKMPKPYHEQKYNCKFWSNIKPDLFFHDMVNSLNYNVSIFEFGVAPSFLPSILRVWINIPQFILKKLFSVHYYKNNQFNILK